MSAAGRRVPVVGVAYALAGLTAVTLVVALVLTNRLVFAFATSVQVSREWTARRAGVFDLAALAASVAPGVDVLETPDIRQARAREQAAMARFQGRLDTLRQVVARELADSDVEPLLNGFQDVALAMQKMDEHVARLFAALERRDRRTAVRELAATDAGHALVSATVAGLRTHMRRLEEDHLARQAAAAQRLARLEYVVAASLLLLALAATAYGTRVARRTQRLAAERERWAAVALRQSEEKFAIAFRSSPNPSIITRLDDGLLVDVNDAYLTATRFTRDEVVGRQAREVLWPHPEGREALVAALRAHGRVRGLELQMRTKSGPPLDVLVSIETIDLDGVPHTLGAAVDMTLQKRILEALRESEQRFRRLVQDLSIGVALLDGKGRVLHCNPASLEMLGVTEQELATEGFWQRELTALHDDGTPYTEEERPVLNAVRTGTALRNIILGHRPRGQGEMRWASFNVDPQRDRLGVIESFIVSFVDITDRKRAAEALAESEERFRRLVQDLNVGVAVLDPQGRILLSNHAGKEMLGIREGEPLPPPDFWQHEMRPLHDDGTPYRDDERPVLKAVLTGTPLRDAVLAYRRHGRTETRWAVFNVDPQRGIDGRVTRVVVTYYDITDRRRANEALRESEERYRTLVETSPDAISVIQDGVVRYINRSAAQLMAAGVQTDVLGKPFLDFVADESRAEAVERIERILRGERDTLGEVRLRRLDGTWAEVEALGIRLEFGGRPAVLVIHRDISERHRAEEQLRLLAQAVKSTTEGISITDLNGRVTFANRAFLEKAGYSEDELIGRPIALVNSPLNPPSLQADIRAATARGTWTGELYNRRKDGTDFLLALTTAPVKDPEGRVIALMGVSSDITRRREAEEQQRRLQEAVLASAVDWTLTFDAVQSPIFVLDSDAHVRRLNAAAREWTGRGSYQDAVGRAPAELGDGEPWRGMAALATEVRRTNTPASSQVFEETARRSWYLTGSPFRVSGEEDRIILIARDVTDLVALQESLRRTETMSALGSLVAGVAHEVRNPLFAISATVDAFEARFGQQEKTARYTTTLRQEVSRLSDLMRGLLEYGKPPRLELSDTALQPIVTGAMERCTALADAGGVRVTSELPDDLPILRLDGNRILQVFQNLIENAIQHSPRGGTVSVRAAAAGAPESPGVDVTVKDQGPGFRPEDLPHIFEPFFTRRRGGTGLGLSIVERILEQHGGDVTAANHPAGGAVMTVHLRLVAPSSPSTAPRISGSGTARVQA